MLPLYDTETLRYFEAVAQQAQQRLMPLAARAAADFVMARYSQTDRFLVLVGPGNNGGDALLTAYYLVDAGYELTVVIPDIEHFPEDAQAAYQQWLSLKRPHYVQLPHAQNWSLIIDGLFGIGLCRRIEGAWQALIEQVNRWNLPVLSLDVPSGVDANRGAVLGVAIRARWTLGFIRCCQGLFTGAALNHVGEYHLADLGVTATTEESSCFWLNTIPETIKQLQRPPDTHKGLFGSVAVIGGADGMVGAALLAARAALKLGAGRVYVGLLSQLALAVDTQCLELMIQPVSAIMKQTTHNVLAIGPGLGDSSVAQHYLQQVLASDSELVMDADALNLIAQYKMLQQQLIARRVTTILTPHPAEAARLLDTDTNTIQADRYRAARALAKQYGCIVVLKGAGSLIVDGARVMVNSTGNPGMSAAGYGDVLTGMIAAFLAQRIKSFDAACLAVYLHGLAADQCVQQGLGLIGMTASEIIDKARTLVAIASKAEC